MASRWTLRRFDILRTVREGAAGIKPILPNTPGARSGRPLCGNDALEKNLSNQRKWLRVQSFALNSENPLSERLRMVDGYLEGSPFLPDAQAVRQQLDLERRRSSGQRRLDAKNQENLVRLQQVNVEQEQRQRRIRQVSDDLEQQPGNSTRFRSQKNGTVKDLRTGLTWCLLDACQELGAVSLFKTPNTMCAPCAAADTMTGGCLLRRSWRRFTSNLRSSRTAVRTGTGPPDRMSRDTTRSPISSLRRPATCSKGRAAVSMNAAAARAVRP